METRQSPSTLHAFSLTFRGTSEERVDDVTQPDDAECVASFAEPLGDFCFVNWIRSNDVENGRNDGPASRRG